MSNRSILNTTHTYATTTTPSFTPAPTRLPETTKTAASSLLPTVAPCNNSNVTSTSPWTHGFTWRLRQFCTRAFGPAPSRRRRKRSDSDNCITANTAISSSSSNSGSGVGVGASSSTNQSLRYAAFALDHTIDHNHNSKNHNNHNNNNCITNINFNRTATTRSPASQLLNGVTQALRGSSAATYIAALLLLTTYCSLGAASPCDNHSWWDPIKDKCIECTVCQGELIPLRPCQLHRDTICGSIYDLKIDWVVLAKTEPNWKERRKDGENFDLEQQLTHEELQQLQDESIPLDWQTTALFLAVLACLLFFIVAAGILVHHMRQWRRMERRLDQDVEELSTKLMAKLAEVQSLEGGTFFIGNAEALRVPTTFQPQHVLLPEKPAKHHERRILKTLQPGNVYIEEGSSKG